MAIGLVRGFNFCLGVGACVVRVLCRRCTSVTVGAGDAIACIRPEAVVNDMALASKEIECASA